jgi:hypothetical protein
VRSRSLLWLTASFVITVGFWIFGHHGGSPASTVTAPRAALCRDVGNLTQAMVQLRAAGTRTGPDATQLGSFQAAFERDAGALGDAGDTRRPRAAWRRTSASGEEP